MYSWPHHYSLIDIQPIHWSFAVGISSEIDASKLQNVKAIQIYVQFDLSF